MIEPRPVAAPGANARSVLTPVEIQQKVFRLAFRGYNERDVDEFLDAVTEDFARLHEDNKRLREALEETTRNLPPSAAQAHRQAEDLVRRAREQAARLVESAEARVAATGPSPAPSWFLREERDFLERLGNLIRDHAENLKREARSARERQTAEGEPLPYEPAPAAAEEAPPEVPPTEPAEPEETETREGVGPGAGARAAGVVQDPFAGWVNPFEEEQEGEGEDLAAAPTPAPAASHPSEPSESVAEAPTSGEPGTEEAELVWEPPLEAEPEPVPDEGFPPEPPPVPEVRESMEPGPPVEREAETEAPDERGEPSPDEEERSLRELFWGEE